MHKACVIIGVLDNGREGLSSAALALIENADLLIGGKRTLELFKTQLKSTAQTKDLSGQLSSVPQWIKTARQQKRSCVVLATGDPLCHGIGKYLLGKLGTTDCEILPNVSTLQLACARFGIAWQGAKICSVHSKDAGEWHAQADIRHGLYPLLRDIQQHDLLAVFSSPQNTPDRIARMLKMENMQDQFSMSVAENLLSSSEKLHTQLSIDQAAQQRFSDPNFILLQRIKPRSQNMVFGYADNSFAQRKPDKGLITKCEVRAVSLARLQLKTDSIVWDIGAGSGSVGLEAAQLCPDGYVYAIEKNAADQAIVKDNQQRLGIHNFKLYTAKAPEHLADWKDPDAVFVGGSGGELAELIEIFLQRLNRNGWLVMNFVTLENLGRATEMLKKFNARWDIVQLQASRSQPILHMHRMQAENPVWIVCAQAQNKITEKTE